MEKHYKLTIGLLACFLGVRLKAVEVPKRTTKDAAVDLRTAASNCAVEKPCDLQGILLTNGPCKAPSNKLLQARRRFTRRAIQVLLERLEPVTTLPQPGDAQEPELAVGTTAARQAAERICVGPVAGPIELVRSTAFEMSSLRGDEFPKIKMSSDELDLFVESLKNAEGTKILMIEYFPYSKTTEENDICLCPLPGFSNNMVFVFRGGQWKMVSTSLHGYRGSKSLLEFERQFAETHQCGRFRYENEDNYNPSPCSKVLLDGTNVYFKILAPHGLRGATIKIAVLMSHLEAANIDPNNHTCQIVFHAPQ